MPSILQTQPKTGHMKIRTVSFLVFVVFLCIYTPAYLMGTAGVPFHPDESSYLYTSGDVELFLRQPSAVFWQSEKEDDPLQKYRELNAPLINVCIAFGRWLSGESPLAMDWDWGASWAENARSGALPSTGQILAARLAVAGLMPVTLLFFFLTLRRLFNDFTAWVGILLLASNALVLLHTRRAMTEGPLLLTSILFLWFLTRKSKHPEFIALPAALAFSAKQSLAPLLPLGFAAAVWPGTGQLFVEWKAVVKKGALYIAWALIVLALLHPFLWSNPVQAVQGAFKARQELAARQLNDRPEQALNTSGRKIIAMVASLYLTPPIFAETANYAKETYAAEQAYLANPLHRLLRSIPAGAILFMLNLFGCVIGFLKAVREKGTQRRNLILLLSATGLQVIALFSFLPLPWQRYYLPLVPYNCIWIAFGIDQLRQAILSNKNIRARRQI
jgi:hypothetical protein